MSAATRLLGMEDNSTANALAAHVLSYAMQVAKNPRYAISHPGEAVSAMAAAALLVVTVPSLSKLPPPVAAEKTLAMGIAHTFGGGNMQGTLAAVASTMGTTESQVIANMGPGVRDMYNQLLRDDPKQARAFLIQEMMASLKLMGEMLSNVSKTRADISMTFARNSRA